METGWMAPQSEHVADKATLPQESEHLALTVHQPGMGVSIYTSKTLKELQNHSVFLKTWTGYKEECHHRQQAHATPQLCFPETVMSCDQQDTLHLLLDDALYFTWSLDHRQHEIFALCCYFLLNQDYIFLTFYRLLHPDYTRDKAYGYLELVLEMVG